MTKTVGIRIRVEPELRSSFNQICKKMDMSSAHVLRQYMKNVVANHEASTQQDFFSDSEKLLGTNNE